MKYVFVMTSGGATSMLCKDDEMVNKVTSYCAQAMNGGTLPLYFNDDDGNVVFACKAESIIGFQVNNFDDSQKQKLMQALECIRKSGEELSSSLAKQEAERAIEDQWKGVD